MTVGQDKDDGSGKWPYAGTAEAVQKMNAVHVNKNVDVSFTYILLHLNESLGGFENERLWNWQFALIAGS